MGGAPTIASRRRIRLFVVIGLSVLTFIVGPLMWLHTRELGALIAVLLMGASYVPPVAVLWTERPRVVTTVQLISAAIASTSLAFFVLNNGGTQSLAFHGTIALPLALALMSRETPLVSLCSGVILAIFSGSLLGHEGRDVVDVAVMVTLSLSAGLLGTYSTVMYQQLQDAELRAEREGRRALEELAMLQRQGAEAERLATVGRLAAGVAHEINNPLAFVSANLEFIKKTVTAGAELDDVLAETEEGLRRIRNIVGDLTELARPATQEHETCDPSGSIETAVRIASVKAKGIASFNVEAVAAPPIAMSGARLVQVLVNLLINAVDAIEAGQKRPGTVWIQLLPGKLVVADDGPGISPQVRDRLFEPFFTTKPAGKGTGLGLALCRQYLSERGFSIAVDERPGGGARFTVSLSGPGATTTTAS